MTLRLLCDENVPRLLVQALRGDGHDVVWVRTDRPGIADQEVLAWAQQEGRICVTFDTDFGHLAVLHGAAAGFGIILLRLPMRGLGADSGPIAAMIAARTDWPGHFSVIDPRRTRMRRLP
jgi:hypothetical protein